MIGSSLDWDIHRQQLKSQIQTLPYNHDLRRLLKNIDAMVDELSRAEVFARRHRKAIVDLPEVKKVNEAIETLEKWIVMAALIR
jgi:hypothetical protein